MEKTMIGELEISLAPESLGEGSTEERAGFGMLTIRAGNARLTEGFDSYIDAQRLGPLVSGYHAAEWFAWNWWRIVHEPFSRGSPDWWRAHEMTAIGEGYVWPNISFGTDGVRAMVIARPSTDPEARPFRYLNSYHWHGSTHQLTEAIDGFLDRVAYRLAEQGVAGSNLHRVLTELRQERDDGDLAKRRLLEALLGRDPDEADDATIQSLLDDMSQLGQPGVQELAAGAQGREVTSAATLRDLAASLGQDVRLADAVRLSTTELKEARTHLEAWRQGRAVAVALRLKEQLGAAPIATPRLSEMLGTTTRTAKRAGPPPPLSFVLAKQGSAKIVLRSTRDDARRFALARLLGDHLLFGTQAPILPATRASTFRQKAQRSFAAEFLCPFEVAKDMLRDDFSSESIEDVAENFNVSTLTVETLLRNRRLIERDAFSDAHN